MATSATAFGIGSAGRGGDAFQERERGREGERESGKKEKREKSNAAASGATTS